MSPIRACIGRLLRGKEGRLTMGSRYSRSSVEKHGFPGEVHQNHWKGVHVKEGIRVSDRSISRILLSYMDAYTFG